MLACATLSLATCNQSPTSALFHPQTIAVFPISRLISKICILIFIFAKSIDFPFSLCYTFNLNIVLTLTLLDSLCDTSFEHQLAAKLREFSRTYGKKSDRGELVTLVNELDKANERGLYRFDEQGHDNLLQLFDCGDKGLKTQLAHIANELDDVDFVVKGILEGERFHDEHRRNRRYVATLLQFGQTGNF